MARQRRLRARVRLADLHAAFVRAWGKAWPTAHGRVSLRLRRPALFAAAARPAPRRLTSA